MLMLSTASVAGATTIYFDDSGNHTDLSSKEYGLSGELTITAEHRVDGTTDWIRTDFDQWDDDGLGIDSYNNDNKK